MIYTKMMDSLNEEETPQEDQVVPQEQPAEVEEISVDDIEALNAYDKEHVELSAEITLKSMEFDKKFAMMSHVAKFGVDRSFLSICNSNNELATELGITLPATEDFEIYGDPNSNTSKKVISSMESFLGFGKKESLWSKFWKWIKEIVGKILGWIKGFFSKVWEFIKKLLGLGKAKLDKIEEVANQLKKAGIKTVDVNEDFARLGQDLQRSFIERQDRLIKSRKRVAFVKDIANTSLKIIKDLVKTRGEWAPARVKELEATTGTLKNWVTNTWDAAKGVSDVVTNSFGHTWDWVNDTLRSFESSARRYAQKTVIEQRRREFLDAKRRSNEPLEDWMADTYTTQGRRGNHTRNTVFDNTDPWDYLHHGPQQSGQQHNQTQQQQQQQTQRQQTQQQTQQQQQQQTQQQTTSMSIEDLIRNHVVEQLEMVLLKLVVKLSSAGPLCRRCETSWTNYNLFKTQVSNSSTTSTHADVVQDNVQSLITTVEAILHDLQQHMHDQGKDLVDANRTAEKQLVDLVHGFHNQVSILGVVIFDSVNDLQNNFTVSSSAIRDVDYRRFGIIPITNANNQQNYRIDEVWVRPERAARVGTTNIGRPDTWGVSIPADSADVTTNQRSVELTCSLPKRSIAGMWRGYQQHHGRHAYYWDSVQGDVTVNVRFYIPLDDKNFANVINNAHASNSTSVTYDFTSMVDPNHPPHDHYRWQGA